MVFLEIKYFLKNHCFIFSEIFNVIKFMKHYDVVIVGGSIAGSVAARYTAENNLNTLLVESAITPREKPCSAIQFKYFEKILGTKIPREKLCSNQLTKLYMEWPNGKAFKLPFKMLNFTRDVFDELSTKVEEIRSSYIS